MITCKSFYLEEYQETVKEFVGLPISFCFDEEENLKDILLTNFDKDLHAVNKNNIDSILATIKKVLLSFYDNYHNLSFRPVYKQLLIEELAYSFIDNSYPETNQSLSRFIEHLKNLCSKTYESESTEMGFIVIKDDTILVKEYLNKLGLNYVKLDVTQTLEYFITDKQTLKIIDSKSVSFVLNSEYKVIGLAKKNKGKQSVFDIMMNRHKYIEEMDIKVLFHNNYVHSHISDDSTLNEALSKLIELQEETVSLIKKEFNISTNEKDIKKIVESINLESFTEEQKNRLNKHINVYISLMDKENEILDEQTTILQERTTSLEYLKSLSLKQEQLLDIHSIVNFQKVDFIYFKNKQIIWSSSYEYIVSYLNGQWKLRNYFVLRSILAKFVMSQYSLSSVSYIVEKIDYSIPRVLDLYNLIKTLSEKNIGSLICVIKRSHKRKESIFKKMLQKGKLSTEKFRILVQTATDKPININSCDTYLFELIASVDGAIILDYRLNILSFGEMISSQKVIVDEGKDYRGARTLAALSASYYGLGLKVSEDGDIQVFEGQNEIARI